MVDLPYDGPMHLDEGEWVYEAQAGDEIVEQRFPGIDPDGRVSGVRVFDLGDGRLRIEFDCMADDGLYQRGLIVGTPGDMGTGAWISDQVAQAEVRNMAAIQAARRARQRPPIMGGEEIEFNG
jgi:hypothetical protein